MVKLWNSLIKTANRKASKPVRKTKVMAGVNHNKSHSGSILKKRANPTMVLLRVQRKCAEVLPWAAALFTAMKIRRERRALICPVASCPAWLASSWVEGDASCAGVLASFASALPLAASCLLNVTGTENTASGLWLLASSRADDQQHRGHFGGSSTWKYQRSESFHRTRVRGVKVSLQSRETTKTSGCLVSTSAALFPLLSKTHKV